MEKYYSNIRRYKIFSTVVHLPFMLPVIVLFWKVNGLDAFDIYILQGIFAIAVVILEVPTGMVADHLGKRVSLLASTVTMFVGMLIYATGHSFMAFLIAEIVFALGGALLSGADSALLYDTLKRVGRQDQYKKIEGTARSNQMIAFALSNIIGGIVGSYSYRATLFLTSLGPLIAFFVAWGFKEAGILATDATEDEKRSRKTYGGLLGDSFRFVRKHRLVRWHVIFFAVLSASSTWLLWIYQPYMKFSGLPVFMFGIAFALFNLFSALMSRIAHRFDEKLGRTGALIAIMGLQILPLPLMAWIVTPVSFLFILGHQAVRGMIRIVVSDRILAYTYADKRATVLSMGALMGRLFFAVTSPAVGHLTRSYSLPVVLIIQGIVLIALLGSLLAFYIRIPGKYFIVKKKVTERQ